MSPIWRVSRGLRSARCARRRLICRRRRRARHCYGWSTLRSRRRSPRGAWARRPALPPPQWGSSRRRSCASGSRRLWFSRRPQRRRRSRRYPARWGGPPRRPRARRDAGPGNATRAIGTVSFAWSALLVVGDQRCRCRGPRSPWPVHILLALCGTTPAAVKPTTEGERLQSIPFFTQSGEKSEEFVGYQLGVAAPIGSAGVA